MASLVDLTQENEENDSDNGHQPSPQELALQGQRQQHLIRIRIDMCPVAKPSIRFGPGRQARGRGQRSHPILYRRYVETDVMQQMEQLRNACIIRDGRPAVLGCSEASVGGRNTTAV
jgi:hypothetical protein